MGRPAERVRWDPVEYRQLGPGVIYEHWSSDIDHQHHVHLPSGETIIFSHEENQGSVKIVPPKGGS